MKYHFKKKYHVTLTGTLWGRLKEYLLCKNVASDNIGALRAES